MKYIFISGGVISGIGKGLTTASISLLLKSCGYQVAPIKFENYLNLDAGTINPVEHGDPFLCEDGTEADMDIGSYEKFLDEKMGRLNFVTMGQIYKTVIEKERRHEYQGEDVEAIPHITDEVNKRIKDLGEKTKADIVVIELGGTAGEYQNILYYEASRILTLKNRGDVIHIHVSYVPVPKHLGEPKTKPTQLSVKSLNSMGIQPDFIIVRSEKYLDQKRLDRFALFCNMQAEDIIINPDVDNIYQIPLIFHQQKLEEKILKKLNLPVKKPNLNQWIKLINKIKKPKKKQVNLVVVGKYFNTGNYQLRDSYAALFDAIDHASWQMGIKVKNIWIQAEKINESNIKKIVGHPDGLIVPIGWGRRGAEGMILASSYARKEKIPFLGLCYGMQLATVAFARDVLGWKDADTTENNPQTKKPVIHLIPSQKKYLQEKAIGGTMRLGGWLATVKKDTLAYKIYDQYDGFIDRKNFLISERHRHRYEFNNNYLNDFEKKGFIVSAQSKNEGLAEIIELGSSLHPFYLGTQGHPEYKSRPFKPHPIFLAFLDACQKRH
ncbi:MAG: CTP synthase [Microgenomates group bacterium]|nr:CTP synthase [Microgenomates group bacterium]